MNFSICLTHNLFMYNKLGRMKLKSFSKSIKEFQFLSESILCTNIISFLIHATVIFSNSGYFITLIRFYHNKKAIKLFINLFSAFPYRFFTSIDF